MISLMRKVKSSCRLKTGFCSSSSSTEIDQKKEPVSPILKTPIPGPKTKSLKEKLKSFQNTSAIDLFAMYDKSVGNYLHDADGNVVLDLNMQFGTLPLGYNHPELMRLLQSSMIMKHIASRSTSGAFPGYCCANIIETIVKKVSPKLPCVATCSCEAVALENILKAMMNAYQEAQTDGGKNEELKSVPPSLCILCFDKADHGTTFGAPPALQSNPPPKARVSGVHWPVAPYPQYKYPLEENHFHNKCQDETCLAVIEDLIHRGEDTDSPIIGIVVEPIQNEGTREASPEFFKGLQLISYKYGIFLVFDESKTGCGATGKFWCHEHFGLACPPDAITFGRKTQIAGYFHNAQLNPKEESRILDTWMGDPAKMQVFFNIIQVIEKCNLMENVRQTGDVLKKGLIEIESRYYDLIHSTRGMGTFLGFTAQCPKYREYLLDKLKNKGILCDKSGIKSISLRPALIFNQNHAHIFLDKLEEVLKETEVIVVPSKTVSSTAKANQAENKSSSANICSSADKKMGSKEDTKSVDGAKDCDYIYKSEISKTSTSTKSICEHSIKEEKNDFTHARSSNDKTGQSSEQLNKPNSVETFILKERKSEDKITKEKRNNVEVTDSKQNTEEYSYSKNKRDKTNDQSEQKCGSNEGDKSPELTKRNGPCSNTNLLEEFSVFSKGNRLEQMDNAGTKDTCELKGKADRNIGSSSYSNDSKCVPCKNGHDQHEQKCDHTHQVTEPQSRDTERLSKPKKNSVETCLKSTSQVTEHQEVRPEKSNAITISEDKCTKGKRNDGKVTESNQKNEKFKYSKDPNCIPCKTNRDKINDQTQKKCGSNEESKSPEQRKMNEVCSKTNLLEDFNVCSKGNRLEQKNNAERKVTCEPKEKVDRNIESSTYSNDSKHKHCKTNHDQHEQKCDHTQQAKVTKSKDTERLKRNVLENFTTCAETNRLPDITDTKKQNECVENRTAKTSVPISSKTSTNNVQSCSEGSENKTQTKNNNPQKKEIPDTILEICKRICERNKNIKVGNTKTLDQEIVQKCREKLKKRTTETRKKSKCPKSWAVKSYVQNTVDQCSSPKKLYIINFDSAKKLYSSKEVNIGTNKSSSNMKKRIEVEDKQVLSSQQKKKKKTEQMERKKEKDPQPPSGKMSNVSKGHEDICLSRKTLYQVNLPCTNTASKNSDSQIRVDHPNYSCKNGEALKNPATQKKKGCPPWATKSRIKNEASAEIKSQGTTRDDCKKSGREEQIKYSNTSSCPPPCKDMTKEVKSENQDSSSCKDPRNSTKGKSQGNQNEISNICKDPKKHEKEQKEYSSGDLKSCVKTIRKRQHNRKKKSVCPKSWGLAKKRSSSNTEKNKKC